MTKYREIENPTAEEVRVGDRVTFTIPYYPESGEVSATAAPNPPMKSPHLIGFASVNVNVLKIERPVPSLPEKDGLYTVARGDMPVEGYRVFERRAGVWLELTSAANASFTGSLEYKVASGQWTLTRLVKEDSNGP